MPLRVFLLEDQTLFRELIVRTLKQSLDVSIIGAFGNAKELVAGADAIKGADVGLLDVRLGASDCFELLPTIRTLVPTARLLWVTSVLEDVLLQRALDAGLPGFIHKDDSAEELITAIQRVAGGETYMSSSVRQRRDTLRNRSDLFSKILSPREQEILKILASGFTNDEAAALLGISPETIKTHRRNIMARLDVHTAAELQGYALRNGFISPSAIR
jgi:DNA-binding NarL/FixJ family response regulator